MDEPTGLPQPRCRGCGYLLEGLIEQRCPECGRPFDRNDPTTYTLKPPFVRWRFWLPGLVLSFGVGLALSALFIMYAGFGPVVCFVVPFSAGSLLGYACRVRRFAFFLLILAAAAGILTGLFSFSFVGIFCGLALAGVFLGPLLIGTLCGAALRMLLKRTQFDQRSHLPVFLIMLATLLIGAIGGLDHHAAPVESVFTQREMPLSAQRAWNGMMFYEEVRGSPPLLMRLLLPRPLYTLGKMESVGDVKICVYNKGFLRKRISAIVPERELDFTVTEQINIENRSVRLTGGSFQFEPIDVQRTRVTLRTDYEPLLSPRWVWRPLEAWAVHTLHEYVLAGMERRGSEQSADQMAVAGEQP